MTATTAFYDLFTDIQHFRQHVPGVSADLEANELNSSAIAARKQIRNIITPALWNILKNEQESEAKDALTTAFGNFIMSKNVVFDAVAKRVSGGADIYKHEQETMRREYLDNYFNAMDTLLEILSTDETYSDTWKDTTYAKLIGELEITDTAELHSYYGIDMSFLFFFRTMSIQRELLLDGLADLFTEAKTDDQLIRKLKLALAQLIIAMALTRFDIIELPATIRSLFDEQKASRSGRDEQNRVLALASELQENAMGIVAAVQLALTSGDGEDIVSETSFNRPEDKIYLLS